MATKACGDGTGMGSPPSSEGLSSNAGKKPEGGHTRGAKGGEIKGGRTAPLGKGGGGGKRSSY